MPERQTKAGLSPRERTSWTSEAHCGTALTRRSAAPISADAIYPSYSSSCSLRGTSSSTSYSRDGPRMSGSGGMGIRTRIEIDGKYTKRCGGNVPPISRQRSHIQSLEMLNVRALKIRIVEPCLRNGKRPTVLSDRGHTRQKSRSVSEYKDSDDSPGRSDTVYRGLSRSASPSRRPRILASLHSSRRPGRRTTTYSAHLYERIS